MHRRAVEHKGFRRMHATALGVSEHFKELGVGMERMMGPDIHEDICYCTYAAGGGDDG